MTGNSIIKNVFQRMLGSMATGSKYAKWMM